jgi:hypothetical protein
MDDALHYYNLGYAEVYIYQNYLISKTNEGEAVLVKHKAVYEKIIKDHFEGRNMVYISNRLHSYAVDPMIYREIVKIKNLLGIATVTYDNVKRDSAAFEKRFSTLPFEIFHELEDAISWANEFVHFHEMQK